MLNELLKKMRWKDVNNKWDSVEVGIDITLLLIAVFIGIIMAMIILGR